MESIIDKNILIKAINQLKEWSFENIPPILLIILLAFFGLLLFNKSLKTIKHTLLRKYRKEEDTSQLKEAEKRIDTLLDIIKITVKIAVWVIVALIILNKIGLNIGPLLAGVGIVGLALGFGAQELVRDVISGFFILLENHIRTGDVAIIDGTGGLVEKINLRTVTLRDLSGVVHIFQNGKINSLSNMTKEWSAMIFNIGVAYKEDTDQVSEIMKEVAANLYADPEYKDKIIEPIEIFGVDEFSDSAVVIKARLKTQPIEQWKVGREYRRRLKKAFDEQGIEIPFPHQTIYWGDKINPLKVDFNNKNASSQV